MSTDGTLRTLIARIETLPASDSNEFVIAASRVLHELRKLDVTTSAANELDGPASVLALSAIRRTYTARLELAKIIISRRQNKGEHIDRERELREAYGDLVARTVIPDLGARQDAHSAEVPMHKFKGGRALSLQVAYDDLLDELGITIGAHA